MDIIGLCHSKYLRLWDLTQSLESQFPKVSGVPPFFPGKNTGHLRMRSYILLIFHRKTTKIVSLFSRQTKCHKATIFLRGRHFWDQHFSFHQNFEREFSFFLSFFISSSWNTTKQTLFQKGLLRIKIHQQRHFWGHLNHVLPILLWRWSSRLGSGSLAPVLTSVASFPSLHMKGSESVGTVQLGPPSAGSLLLHFSFPPHPVPSRKLLGS